MKYAADENFNRRILVGLRARLPELDIIRIQDTEMYQAPDPELLEWVATEKRILLTHDVKTIPAYVYERVRLGQPVPGIIEVHDDTPIGQAIDDLEILIGAGTPQDFENQVKYVPIQ